MKQTSCRFSRCLYFSTSALARKVEKLAVESWSKTGLAPGHAYLLMMVLEYPGIQPGALAEELQLKPSTVTRFIEKLEARKLVIRSSDGKLTNVYPTPRAKELLPELKACQSSFSETYTQLLGREESLKLVAQMNTMADKMTD